MVIKKQGGIFEASQPYNGSHFGPDSYESKLPLSEMQPLGDFLARLPESDASGEDVHFIVSFLKDGNWVTRTYGSLPAGNPFKSLLKRMIQQSVNEQREGLLSKSAEFLAPEQ